MREFSMSEKLMYMKANLHEDIYISVNGISMLPTLNQGDIVCTSAQEVYSVGDIVVFFFHKFVLIHRIIDINQGKILCKGDNAFAAEEIDNKKIIGKVTYVNQVPILQWPTILISFSYRINLLFNTERSIDKVKKTMVYSVYKKLLKVYGDCTKNNYFNDKLFEYLLYNGSLLTSKEEELVSRMKKVIYKFDRMITEA